MFEPFALGVPTEHFELQDKAHRAVTKAIQDKQLLPAHKWDCVACGVCAARHWHHHSYEERYWLDVAPLCDSCHKILHLHGVDGILEMLYSKAQDQFRLRVNHSEWAKTRPKLTREEERELILNWHKEATEAEGGDSNRLHFR